jgi:hypothetical protein
VRSGRVGQAPVGPGRMAAMKRWWAATMGIEMMVLGAGAVAAAPPSGTGQMPPAADSRRFVPPNTPGQAGQNELRLKSDPPGLVGPGVDLVVNDGRLTGELQGHAVDVSISGGHAEGTGPGGRVSLDFGQSGDGLLVSGVWNDHKVNLLFSASSISGRLMQSVTPTGSGVKSCRFDINQVSKGATLSGLSECLGYSEPVRYSIQPASTSELTSPDVALLLIAFFESPAGFAVR